PNPTGGSTSHQFLRETILLEMKGLIPIIANKLVELPLADGKDAGKAGPPFELPYTLRLPDQERAAWRAHRDVVNASLSLAPFLQEAEKKATGKEDPFVESLVALDTTLKEK